MKTRTLIVIATLIIATILILIYEDNPPRAAFDAATQPNPPGLPVSELTGNEDPRSELGKSGERLQEIKPPGTRPMRAKIPIAELVAPLDDVKVFVTVRDVSGRALSNQRVRAHRDAKKGEAYELARGVTDVDGRAVLALKRVASARVQVAGTEGLRTPPQKSGIINYEQVSSKAIDIPTDSSESHVEFVIDLHRISVRLVPADGSGMLPQGAYIQVNTNAEIESLDTHVFLAGGCDASGAVWFELPPGKYAAISRASGCRISNRRFTIPNEQREWVIQTKCADEPLLKVSGIITFPSWFSFEEIFPEYAIRDFPIPIFAIPIKLKSLRTNRLSNSGFLYGDGHFEVDGVALGPNVLRIAPGVPLLERITVEIEPNSCMDLRISVIGGQPSTVNASIQLSEALAERVRWSDPEARAQYELVAIPDHYPENFSVVSANSWSDQAPTFRNLVAGEYQFELRRVSADRTPFGSREEILEAPIAKARARLVGVTASVQLE
jgi:hypothetical protein